MNYDLNFFPNSYSRQNCVSNSRSIIPYSLFCKTCVLVRFLYSSNIPVCCFTVRLKGRPVSQPAVVVVVVVPSHPTRAWKASQSWYSGFDDLENLKWSV